MSELDIYSHRRDPEYAFPPPGTKTEFAAEDTGRFLEILRCGGESNARGGEQGTWVENEGQFCEGKMGEWIGGVTSQPNAETQSISDGAQSGLKILFGVCGYNPEKRCPILPLREDTYRVLEKHFGISDQFLDILTGTIPRAFKHTPVPQHSSERRLDQFCAATNYVFRFSIFRPSFYQVSISYDGLSHTTFALILARRPEHAFPSLITSLKSGVRSCSHPLFIPCLVIQIVIESVVERINIVHTKLDELEEMMGQHEYVNRPVGNPLEMDFVAVTRKLNSRARVLGVEKMRAGSLVLALDLIAKERRVLAKETPGSDIEARVTDMIEEKVADQLNVVRNVMLRAEANEKRIQTQLSVVYQFMAQKDSRVNISLAETSATIAAETKKDGSAMKAIAVLTMCFLPGTFLAALFAMPVFNWDSGTLVAKDGFRLYWVIAVPLTLAVLFLWVVSMVLPWSYWANRLRMRRERRDAESGGLGVLKNE